MGGMPQVMRYEAKVVVTGTGEVIRDGCLVAEGERIAFVGPAQEGKRLYPEARVYTYGQHILLPGLVNTHTHTGMTLLRGYADDLPLKSWLEDYMWPREAEFGDREVYWGSALAVLEMIEGGTTLFADMYDHMDQVARVVQESGIRASLSRGVIGLGDPQVVEAKIREMEQFARQFQGAADGRITTMVAPHSAYTCPPEVIAAILEVARTLHLPVHIHISETLPEVEENLKQYGKRPVEHLYSLGLFEHHTLLAHAVHLNREEMELLQSLPVYISHNPGSNLKLASGIAPVPEMLRRGMVVSLGTDSAASNNNLDMWEELRLAALLHKGTTLDPLAINASQALEMATLSGAKSLGLEQVTGSLEVGKAADFVVVELSTHHTPMYDPVSHLVYTARASDVMDVVVGGQFLMRNREVLTLDKERILYEAQQISNKWK